ncbi:site-specific integrase [[Bacillus] caldolyticus]|uniref:Site-specific integrase n=1 Tax=Bacillus caldolyticus TaxID=1394 RepID=A0ABM6QKY3_BACCL|nr:site-specific integrase [[Bacillus] caldolyticus]AUI36113.1 site-specific integrase [[Bacillus] caldolyticus]
MAGSIEKHGKNSYRLVYSMGFDANGKRIKRTKTVHVKTKKEAEKELAKFIAEIEAGEYIKPAKMSLSDFIQLWRDNYAEKQLSPKTFETYNNYINTRIIPQLGHLQLADIKPIHLIRFLNNLKKNGTRLDGKNSSLSEATINYYRRILKNIFSRAVEWKFLQVNPAEKLPKEKESIGKGNVYDENETRLLLKCLEKEDLKWRLYFTLALTCGLRKGELLALQWEDIDLESGTLYVRHSLSYTKEKGFFLKEPKTKRSKREIAIPSFVLPLLKKYKNVRLREKEKLQDEWEGGNYNFVFATWNGKPHHHSYPRTKWERFLKRNNLRYIRPHDLRHTSATIMLNNGVNYKTVSERLGHSSTRITFDFYVHRTKEADRSAAECFDNQFGA